MHVIKGMNANELFVNIAQEMLARGRESRPRDQKTIELENVWLELSNPGQSIVTLPSRGINHEYLKRELAWYDSGDLRVEEIEKASKFWSKLQDSNKTVNSNYGFLASFFIFF